jgi:hypothetical protein
MLNKLQCENYFLNILSGVIFNEETEKRLEHMGVDFHAWPSSPIKTIAIDFLNLRESKGRPIAVRTMAMRIEDLVGRGEIPIEPISHDYDLFKAEYDQKLATWTGILIADQLRQSPEDWERVISQFKRSGSTSVVGYNLVEYINGTLQRYAEKSKDGQIKVVVPNWGYLSDAIGGFNPNRVNILVAQTGVGKTLWALNLALDAIEIFPVLFFNMEMNLDDFAARAIQSRAGVTVDDWNSGKIESVFAKSLPLIDDIGSKNKFIVTDGRALSLNKLIATIYQEHEKNKIKMVFVDYDQKIMMPGFDEEWRALLKGLMALEEVAKDLDLNIWVLAQGDEKGDPKASKRAMQPASAILHLEKTKGDSLFVLTAKKNRFGKNGFQINLLFDDKTLKLSESGPFIGESERWYQKK